MGNYTGIFCQPGGQTVFSYRSGLLVYEESFTGGMLVSSGYNTAGFPLNVLSNCPTRINHRRMREPSVFNLEINGRTADNAWKFLDFSDEKTENGRKGVISLENTRFPVSAKIYTLLDGTQMLTRYYELTNTGNEPLTISRLSLLSGAVETMEKLRMPNSQDPAEIYDIGYFDSHTWGREGQFNWHTLTGDCHSFETKFGSERFRHPAVFVRNRIMGTMFFAQIAWTGGCRFAFNLNIADDANERGTPALLSTCMELCGYSPLNVLMPGETLTTPEIYFGMLTGDLDGAVNEMNAHIRRSVLNMPEANGDRLLVGAGMGAEHDMSVETSKAFMRQMKEMGGEIFIIDAGWQNPPHEEMKWYDYNGINAADADRYPGGIRELCDYAHSIGLGFGMWMEPERLGKLAPMYESHPEWFPTSYFGEKKNGFIDLTIPEAAQWVEDEIARIITDYRLDLFRLDHNGTPDYFCMGDVNGSGIEECKSIRLIQATYRIYRNLKRRFPEVIFENCAGGGGRTDLGMMKAFNHTWVSDWQRLPRSVEITSGMTLVLPPERVDRLFAGMGSHEIGSLVLNMRNTMLGHMSLNVINPAAAQINSDVMAFVKHSVQLYKDFIRPFIPQCSIYHYTPEFGEAMKQGFSAIGIVAEDRTKGVLLAAALTAPAESAHIIRPRGLDRSKTYRVTLDNTGDTFTASGSELINSGLHIDLPAALTSELVIFEAE